MLIATLLILTTLFVAYSNGANDNFKGVATLFGSNTVDYRGALALATVTTFAGALCSIYFAEALVHAFSGRGLVPDSIAVSPAFLLSVAAGAGATVMFATLFGFPISTTHALTGALAGSGLIAAGSQLNLAYLGTGFFAPLLAGPILAIFLTVPFYMGLRTFAGTPGIRRESCVCVGARQFVSLRQLQIAGNVRPYATPVSGRANVDVTFGNKNDCIDRYGGNLFGISGQSLVNSLHYLSAGTVSFARGLNDTPKIVGLLLAVNALQIEISMLAIATAMAIGGLLSARKVAMTMSRKIARMDDVQALAANMVTALLVIGASRLGLPVSTTHVSVGSISAVGLVNGTVNRNVMGGILASWLLTLPFAAIIGAVSYTLLALPQLI